MYEKAKFITISKLCLCRLLKPNGYGNIYFMFSKCPALYSSVCCGDHTNIPILAKEVLSSHVNKTESQGG